MRDDETTATQLQAKLAAEGVYVSLTTQFCATVASWDGFIEAQHIAN